ANLIGGWLATRYGIPRMLACGLGAQILGLSMLSALDPAWSAAVSVAWVVLAQGICGIAKDLTKTASKSAIKATSQEGNGQLFRWVAWFTGSKNATKGAGFFVGGLLLQVAGYRPALWLMAALLAFVLAGVVMSLPRTLGKAKASKSVRELFAKSRAINLMAAARIFLFGARDVWFVVGLPVFLYAAGWRYMEVAGFIALWTIAYGGIQAVAPAVVTRSRDGLSREVPAARMWGVLLTAIPAALAIATTLPGMPRPDLVLVAGLLVFGFVFAVISSLHSYLILAYAGSEKAAEDVGFYYAANAAGRLLGILLSGALTQAAGMAGCLWGSSVMLAVCLAITVLLPSGAEARRVPA
ncbi:MAG: organoarsenical effux MFS transporter ArsJ, partial [Acetobacteraceae bacterium]